MILLQKGDVVLAHFPFSDLLNTKLRPAIVLCLSTVNQEVTVCFITSKNADPLSTDEFLIHPSDPDFQATGLKVVSKVRVTKIVTLERKLITRKLGELDKGYRSTLNTIIIQAFQLNEI